MYKKLLQKYRVVWFYHVNCIRVYCGLLSTISKKYSCLVVPVFMIFFRDVTKRILCQKQLLNYAAQSKNRIDSMDNFVLRAKKRFNDYSASRNPISHSWPDWRRKHFHVGSGCPSFPNFPRLSNTTTKMILVEPSSLLKAFTFLNHNKIVDVTLSLC